MRRHFGQTKPVVQSVLGFRQIASGVFASPEGVTTRADGVFEIGPHDVDPVGFRRLASRAASAMQRNQKYQYAISATTPTTQTVAAVERSLREEVGTTRQTISVTSRHTEENTAMPKKGQPRCPDDQKNEVMMSIQR